MKNKTKKLNYISLFSCGGIGCFGFKESGFNCVATLELFEKRINIQRINNKCEDVEGYIQGDITKPEIKERLFKQVKKTKEEIDVIVATPPCQGMSIANQKKNDEINRNSLVVNAINIINEIKPNIFIFENVSQFLTTTCTGSDGVDRKIKDEIDLTLGEEYCISSKIINFKNYGSNSSRTRTIVIGVKKTKLDLITPFEIFPDYKKEKTLREVISHFKPLTTMNENDINEPLHHFKAYDQKFTNWIKDVKEGCSAFDNKEDIKKPHSIKDGKLVIHTQKFGDKYKRQIWDKVAPCIHTAN
ncbi:MAG: DNA cytosine methyltransferase, partial [Mycoplasma sp.]